MDRPKKLIDFIDSLSRVKFLSPGNVTPEWMYVDVAPMSLNEASRSMDYTPTNRNREWFNVRAAIRGNEVLDETITLAFDKTKSIMEKVTGGAPCAVWDASEAAAWYACGLLVEDEGVDITWLRRWWEAWRLGYYPIREDGDVLVVAEVKR